jgi:DNA-directed RNA polymerase subunit E'/Rpb7
MNTLISPFIETEITKKISLLPFELNNEILYNIKNKLKTLEKKCIEKGYLVKTINIKDYKDGIIYPEDLMCKTTYTVIFSAVVCDPQVHSIIITQLKRIDSTLISSENEPIKVLTQVSKIEDPFTIQDDSINIYDKILVPGDYVKIKVLAKKCNVGDTIIRVFGQIVGIPTEDEINEFYSNK